MNQIYIGCPSAKKSACNTKTINIATTRSSSIFEARLFILSVCCSILFYFIIRIPFIHLKGRVSFYPSKVR